MWIRLNCPKIGSKAGFCEHGEQLRFNEKRISGAEESLQTLEDISDTIKIVNRYRITESNVSKKSHEV
jgi:hypothetical protein